MNHFVSSSHWSSAVVNTTECVGKIDNVSVVDGHMRAQKCRNTKKKLLTRLCRRRLRAALVVMMMKHFEFFKYISLAIVRCVGGVTHLAFCFESSFTCQLHFSMGLVLLLPPSSSSSSFVRLLACLLACLTWWSQNELKKKFYWTRIYMRIIELCQKWQAVGFQRKIAGCFVHRYSPKKKTQYYTSRENIS